ncbi:MAG: septum formation inhibitor Maf [Butyricicoccus sp.]|nr:septum formation inhibitor Maf [Butyricicoccus sp.]
MELILASQSPRRRELLGLIAADFSVCPADIDETMNAALSMHEQVADLSARKARAVAQEHPGAAVVGSDTVVVLDGVPLGKPVDEADAKRMLSALAGRAHEVVTGVALALPDGSVLQDATVTRVRFAPLAEGEIDWYISTREPMDKAGAYGIQGLGARFIEGIEGDYYSVMGLPVRRLYEMLQESGII